MSQKELQRVTVIPQCAQGNLTCARAAEQLDVSPRHVKRLKARYRARQRSGPGTRQPRPTQPPAHAASRTPARPGTGADALRGLQRSASPREARRKRSLLSKPRNLATAAPRQRHRLAPQTPPSRSSPAPPALGPRRPAGATRRLPLRRSQRHLHPQRRSLVGEAGAVAPASDRVERDAAIKTLMDLDFGSAKLKRRDCGWICSRRPSHCTTLSLLTMRSWVPDAG